MLAGRVDNEGNCEELVSKLVKLGIEILWYGLG
jgi:hypothetical protein